MFQLTKRGWEARVVRDSIDVQRRNAYQTNRKAGRRHSTLEEQSGYLVMHSEVGDQQHYFCDRKDKKKERRYTSSAFDTIKTSDGLKLLENGSTSSDLNSSLYSSERNSKSSPAKVSLTIEIPDPVVKQAQQTPPTGRPSGIPKSQRPLRKDKPNDGSRVSYAATHTHNVARTESVYKESQMFRVTSNFESSSGRLTDFESDSPHNRNFLYKRALDKKPLDMNGLVPIQSPDKRMQSDLASPRHADRVRTPRQDGLMARVSPRSPNIHYFSGRPTRNFAKPPPKLASRRVPSSANVVKTLSFDDEDDKEPQTQKGEQWRKSHGSGSSRGGSSEQIREDSNFSRLSAQSWMSIDSEEALTENETKILTSRMASYSRNTSCRISANRPRDHNPATLFGVDEDGNGLERMSNEDPYCLSVLECCLIVQTGADISKKLSLNRYEQRRVWMSSDFLRLCWTSKKTGVNEDHIKLSQVAKIKLTDRSLTIEMIGGYVLCFMFPNMTSVCLWVRALTCLIPLQACIKVPLDVVIASERDREEFSLAEDKFRNRPIREYMSVNNYVPICNPLSTPRNFGLKMAFSFSDDRVYGFRYIPRQAIHFILRTKKEIAVLRRLKHPNIVKHLEILQDETHGGMYVVFEYLSRGCIADSSNLQRMQIYKEAHVRMILLDVVDALLYLHSMGISHADVRPENILMAPNGCAKLNPIGCIMHDFNRIENRTAHLRCRLGEASTAFLAPEQCWLSKAPKAGRASTAMDVWGVGALMYTLLYGKTPFNGSNNQEVQENICWSTVRFPMEIPMSKEAKSLMFQILTNKDPRTRMSMAEVRDHPWFNGPDYTIIGPVPARKSFSEFYDSPGDGSAMLGFSVDEIRSAVQPAKVRVTAKKKKASRESAYGRA